MYKVEITNKNKYELELKRANVIVGTDGTVEPVWGTITGDITQQKDLQEELTGIKESIPDLTQVKEDIANLESVKADKSEIPDVTELATKEELTDGLATKADTSSLLGLATKQELESKADSADVYTKDEVNQKIDDAITGGEVDLSNYYTKAETYSRKEVDEMIPTLEWIDV